MYMNMSGFFLPQNPAPLNHSTELDLNAISPVLLLPLAFTLLHFTHCSMFPQSSHFPQTLASTKAQIYLNSLQSLQYFNISALSSEVRGGEQGTSCCSVLFLIKDSLPSPLSSRIIGLFYLSLCHLRPPFWTFHHSLFIGPFHQDISMIKSLQCSLYLTLRR